MKCVICRHGETAPGEATVTLNRASTTVVFKNVPALVCDTCGEEYVDEGTTDRLLTLADQATKAGVQVEVRSYAAA